MFRTLSRRRMPNRRGAILLVVLTLLALFAVIGLSFALYAENEATAARIHREGESRTGEAPPDPTDYFNAAMGAIIYPVSDLDPVAAQSGFRGYELARLMYGYNPYTPATGPLNTGGHDLSPFNGMGLFINGQDSLTILGTPIDRSQIVNYSYQAGLPAGSQIVIDPEWSQLRTNILDPSTFGTRTYRSIAAPYTYPDLKDLPLAVFNPTTGAVTQPSCYRTYGSFTSTGGAGLITGLEPTNLNWTTPQGRLFIIRPRPFDQLMANDFTAIGTPTPTPAQVQTYVASNGLFPYPPPNADGSVTGDVQNIPNPQGQQRNDAMWIYPAGPVRRWNGKLYTALVAPTVIELNGRVNLSMAGNIKNNNTAPLSHASDAGVGQWEINPRWVLDNAGLTPASQTALLQILGGWNGVQGRYGSSGATAPPTDRITNQLSPSGLPMMQFNGGLIPPSYARANVDGVGNGSTDRAQLAGNGTSPFPAFQNYNTRYYDSSTYVKATPLVGEWQNHPAQFNPDFWPSSRNAIGGRTFPPFDLLRLGTRYGDQWSRYNQADLAQLAQQYLVSANYPAGQFTTTDTANLVRMLTTTQSSSLNRPEVQVFTGPPASPGATPPSVRLGPIDLNRPLADFRVNTGAAPSPANVYQPTVPAQYANYALARRARQNFARDIFIRLAAITGQIDGNNVAYNSATGYLNNPATAGQPLATGGTPATQQQFNNLRSIAQLAANLVDYIDSDDINTAFVWNPLIPNYVDPNPALMGMNFIDPSAHMANFATTPTNQLGLSVVFGTELPRLVVNEAYGMLTNNQADIGQNKAANRFRMAFWVELVNPLGAADPVLSDNGAARLQYQAGALPPGGTAYPVHQVLISYPDPTKPASTLSTALSTTPSNVTGDPFQVANLTTKIQLWNYSPSAPPNPAPVPVPNTDLVLPVQGQATGTANSNTGYYVIGPQQQGNPAQDIFPGGPVPCTLWLADPTNPPAPGTTVDSMVYEHSGNTSTDLTGAGGVNLLGRSHTVILRRLANPYLPPNDPNWQVDTNDPLLTNNPKYTYNANMPVNPYITVDFVENVPTRDRVTVTGDQGQRGNGAGQDTNPSVGKRHVYGASNGPLGPAYLDNPATVNQAITQQGAIAPPKTPPAAPQPYHTFFAANNPFGDPGKAAGGSLQNANSLAWMAHLDRQLINPLEMVSVSAVAPALVTQNFTYWPTGAGAVPSYNRHTAESLFLPGLNNGVLSYFGVTPLPQPTATGTSPYSAGFLSRALDLLTVRGFLTGVPVGGREQGKLNINTIWHQALLQALLDSNGGNYFTTNDVTSLWQRMTNTGGTGTYTAARSQWNNAQSQYNATSGDAPIWGLATYDPNLVTATSTSAAYNNLQRTILRSPDGNGGVSNSLLYNPNPPATLATTTGDGTHVVGVAEPLRKAWNSTTTTGNTFLVVMTVGYFEVRADPSTTGGRVYLGKELYKEVPGDLRQKFVSVIDRSNLSLDLTSPLTGTPGMGYLQGYTTTANAPSQPWFTTLTTDVQPGATQIAVVTDAGGNVYVGGVPVKLIAGQQLWLGFGNGFANAVFGNVALNSGDGEMVTVLSVTPNPAPSGTAIVTLTSPTQGYHPVGSPVSNQLLGNPGPQPSFDYRDRRYQGVVPYCVRVTPSP